MNPRSQATADRPAEVGMQAGGDPPNGATETQPGPAEAVDVPGGAEQRPARKRLPTRVPAGRQSRGQARPQVRSSSVPVRPIGPDQPAGDKTSAERPGGPQEQPTQESVSGLSARLMALARMIQIGSARSGRDAFGEKLLTDAEGVLARAGDRMRLSSSHTVVVLAGGTGSGKSSLFNRIAGADFSPVGVTRPVTKDAHACVWGDINSGAILDWLEVPGRYRYSRASALDSGEVDLAGLVLLDLPDHDSVMNQAGERANRLVNM